MRASVNPNTAHTHQPDMFSRGTVRLTFKVLRHTYPSLALNVRNLLGTNVSPQHFSSLSEQIHIDLEEQQIEKIVAALYMLKENAGNEAEQEGGYAMLLQLLIHEWGYLDDWLFSQSQMTPKPSSKSSQIH